MARRSVQNLDVRSVEKLLTACLPRPLSQLYLQRILHWISCKGPEWTALRLKALWNVALLLRSGDHQQIPEVLSKARIACASGLPKDGVERALVLSFAHAQKPTVLRRVATALRAYTGITLTNESRLQVDKSRSSINDPGCGNLDMRPLTDNELRRIRVSASNGVVPRLEFGDNLYGLLPFNGNLDLRR
jgi:hypothetical protein